MHLEILKEVTVNGTVYWWAFATYKGVGITRWSVDRHGASWSAVKDAFIEGNRGWGQLYNRLPAFMEVN
jgi:hypothetical protein